MLYHSVVAPRIYTKRETKPLLLNISPELHEALRERAEYEGRSMNFIAERVITAASKRWNTSSKEGKK